jgi:hypothetical protein
MVPMINRDDTFWAPGTGHDERSPPEWIHWMALKWVGILLIRGAEGFGSRDWFERKTVNGAC